MIDAPLPPPPAAPGVPSAADLLALLPRFSGSPVSWWRDLPWSVVRDGDSLLLTLDRLHEERLADPANREVVMACGAVAENLRVAARHYGVNLVAEYWPEGESSSTIARFTPQGAVPSHQEESALFGVLVREGGPVRRVGAGATSPALVAVLKHAARCEGAWLDVISDDARRAIVSDLESEATTIADAERSARRLVSIRLGGTTATPQFALGGAPSLGELLGTLGTDVQPSNEWCAGRSSTVRGSTLEAPLLAVLGADEDGPAGWLRAGAALQRVLLHASVQGLSATFLNEPLHHPLLRDAVRSILFAGGAPQAIVCFDYAGWELGARPRTRERSATAA